MSEAVSRSTRRQRRRMIFALIMVAFFVGLFEVLLRLVFPFPEVRSFNRINFSRRGDAGPKDSRYALSNATLTFESALDDHSCRIRLNRYGYRDRDWRLAKSPDRRRIAVVGDSFVEGFMVERDESVPAVMGTLLGDGCEVMNFGIGGVGIPETLRSAREVIRLFRPDELVFLLYANDLPTPPFQGAWLHVSGEDEFEPIWKPRLITCVKELSRGNGLPKRWTKEVRYLPAVPNPSNPYTENADKFGFVEQEVAELMKEARFNPYLTNELWVWHSVLQLKVDVSPQIMALRTYAARHGVKLRVGFVPSRHQVTDHYHQFAKRYSNEWDGRSMTGEEFQGHRRMLAEACAKAGVPFVDCSEAVGAAEAAGQRLYWDYDDHMRPAGYRLVAEKLAELVAP